MNQPESLSPKEAAVIALAAQNLPQRQIGAEVGTSQTSVHRITSKHKELIQSENAKLIENTLSTITNRITKEINLANSLEDKELLDPTKQQALSRSDKREEIILKSVGMAPTNSPSFHYQQIFNDNRKQTISPVVSELIQGKIQELTEPIDAEVIEG